MKVEDIIKIDEYSATPKYLQLANSVLYAIEAGKISINDLLPSINELTSELEVSRDTVEKGYKHLKKLGVLLSVPGKGYYIQNIDFRQILKVFLLFNKLSAHKKIIYDAFISAIGEEVAVDFYIYNNDSALFKKLLNIKKEGYTHYVIIPHFLHEEENTLKIINSIPKEKLIILDKLILGLTGNYAAVYEDFEFDIYNSLEKALDNLQNYSMLKLIFPAASYYPKEIKKGFIRFCQQYAFNFKIVNNIAEERIEKSEVYINLREKDLVKLIERIVSLNFQVGPDVGIISYNETPLKKFLLNGITTISTDFEKMGTMAAYMIKNNKKEKVAVPFNLILRNSLCIKE